MDRTNIGATGGTEAVAAAACGARTRDGSPCAEPPMPGRRRCRKHGGAAGVGAPRGNRNALRHGFYSTSFRERRRLLASLAHQNAATIATVKALELLDAEDERWERREKQGTR